MTKAQSNNYLFDTGSAEGARHMQGLTELFDQHTFALLDPVVGPGRRCLDLGAGGGSVTSWLADRVGPTGEVVAVDVDTTRLPQGPGIIVQQHDINDGLTHQLAGPYDLIHARLLLMHLPRRDQIVTELVESLAPGGSLVIGDASGRPLTVVSPSHPGDIALWKRIQYLSNEVVGPAGGIDFGWANRIDQAMVGAGLIDIDGIETSQTVRGGSPGALLHATLNLQAREPLLAAGAQQWELDRYQELTRDPEFQTWFYQFICLRGRRAS